MMSKSVPSKKFCVVFSPRWCIALWQIFSRQCISRCWTLKMWCYSWRLQRNVTVEVGAPAEAAAIKLVHPFYHCVLLYAVYYNGLNLIVTVELLSYKSVISEIHLIQMREWTLHYCIWITFMKKQKRLSPQLISGSFIADKLRRCSSEGAVL